MYLLYNNRTRPTGERLATYLGIPSGPRPREQREDTLIRWGNAVQVRRKPRKVFNYRSAILTASNKLDTLVTLRNAGVPVPNFSTVLAEVGLPAVARKLTGQGGRYCHLILQTRDVDRLPARPDFFTSYIPKNREYRAHVIDGKIAQVQTKVLDNDRLYDPVVWNHDTGWRFVLPNGSPHRGVAQAAAAVTSLRLHFGAVDLVIGEDNRPYVLEVNTGPGLARRTLDLYGSRLAALAGITDYPGIEAVAFPEEE